MKISKEMMEHISILAKLELSEEEKKKSAEDMEQMLKFIELLKELDTDGIEPLSHIFPAENAFREDVITNGDMREQILDNAPEQKDGMFKVPRTIE